MPRVWKRKELRNGKKETAKRLKRINTIDWCTGI